MSDANEEKKQEATKPSAVSLIPIGSDGRIVARDNQEMFRYANSMLLGGAIPERFDTPQKAYAALMFVRDLRLPDTAIRQVANIHGTMSAFGDIPLALAQRSPMWGKIKEQWFDPDYNVICFENKNLNAPVYGAVCHLSRGKDEPQSFAFTMDDAQAAGLYPAMKWNKELKRRVENPDSPWMKYTKLMLRYKARSIAIKSLYADCVNGLAIGEYDFDSVIDGQEVHVNTLREVGEDDDRNKSFRDELRAEGGENG